MAGLYGRMVDPNFAAPTRGGVGANAGIGAPGSAGLPRQQDDNFDAAQMAGLLGMLAKQKKPGEEVAAPGAAPGAEGLAAQPGMTPITNGGNFDMAQAMPGVMPGMQGQLPGSAAFQDSTGVNTGFAMPPSGSGEAFQLGGIGTSTPMSNFGAGIPAAAPQIPAALPQGILPQGIDFSQMPFAQTGGFGFGGGAG